jgi:hypothetical protein
MMMSARLPGVSEPACSSTPMMRERVHERQETVRQRRMYDDQGMDVRRDGGMIGEDGGSGGSISVLVGAGRRIIPEGDGEGQQVPFRRTLGVVDQQPTESRVEAFVFGKNSIRPSGIRGESDGQWDHERQMLALRDELVDASQGPVGICIDVLIM